MKLYNSSPQNPVICLYSTKSKVKKELDALVTKQQEEEKTSVWWSTKAYIIWSPCYFPNPISSFSVIVQEFTAQQVHKSTSSQLVTLASCPIFKYSRALTIITKPNPVSLPWHWMKSQRQSLDLGSVSGSEGGVPRTLRAYSLLVTLKLKVGN